FLSEGGQGFQYIPCLNDEPVWIKALTQLVLRHMQDWPTRREDQPSSDALVAQRSRADRLSGRG
ncbi:MAG: ferrochelatase, partial [Aquabacterium sp.]